MSERPTADPVQRSKTSWPKLPWADPGLRGTEITWPFGGNAKLVIDKDGNAWFTDASGEVARWDDTMFAWVDPDTGEIEPFAPPFDIPAELMEEAAQRLDAEVAAGKAQLEADPGLAYTQPELVKAITQLEERAQQLHASAAPYQPAVGGET